MIRSRNWLLAAFLGTALVASALVVLGVGAVHVPVHDVIRVVARRFRLINGSDVTVLDDRIVWQLRAPRVIGAMAVGALLAMCGAVLQTLTGNELADPYLLGISSGASVGAVLVIVVGMSSALGQSILMAVASFAGAVGALIIVLALATGRSGELPTSRTILAGVAVGQLCAAGVSMMIMVFAESNAVRSVLSWTLGSFTGLRWGSTVTLSVVTVPAFIAGMAVCHTLDAFAFGDVSAMSLGIPVNAVRWSIMVGTALLPPCASPSWVRSGSSGSSFPTSSGSGRGQGMLGCCLPRPSWEPCSCCGLTPLHGVCARTPRSRSGSSLP